MLRIKTLIEKNKILTIFFNGKWHTISALNDKSKYGAEADNLFDAGQNHLRISLQIKELVSKPIIEELKSSNVPK